jgi:hypothetical protein
VTKFTEKTRLTWLHAQPCGCVRLLKHKTEDEKLTVMIAADEARGLIYGFVPAAMTSRLSMERALFKVRALKKV